ncbi:kinase-like domain-containing protein [Xylariaceae sp. FL1019]|nr:kinase-like domain-containing protein [Xylariaceae sp. FL1019]
MESHTPIRISWMQNFAPAPVPLPSLDELIAEVENLSPKQVLSREEDRLVFKHGDKCVVKLGKGVNLLEGENMLIVQQYTHIPVPALYAMYHDEANDIKAIIVEYIPGKTLLECYHDLSDLQKASIGAQLRSHLAALRKVPTPGLYGRLGDRPFLALPWVFKEQVGPFTSAEEFLEAYFESQFTNLDRSGQVIIDQMKTKFLRLSVNHHTPVFTHADLQAKNIMLRDDDTVCIIDWESAAFCPEYFEFFIYGTFDMASAGLSRDTYDPILDFEEMVSLIKEVWGTFVEIRNTGPDKDVRDKDRQDHAKTADE